eukprot:889179-Prorocentrum_minimum.AAC.4
MSSDLWKLFLVVVVLCTTCTPLVASGKPPRAQNQDKKSAIEVPAPAAGPTDNAAEEQANAEAETDAANAEAVTDVPEASREVLRLTATLTPTFSNEAAEQRARAEAVTHELLQKHREWKPAASTAAGGKTKPTPVRERGRVEDLLAKALGEVRSFEPTSHSQAARYSTRLALGPVLTNECIGGVATNVPAGITRDSSGERVVRTNRNTMKV